MHCLEHALYCDLLHQAQLCLSVFDSALQSLAILEHADRGAICDAGGIADPDALCKSESFRPQCRDQMLPEPLREVVRLVAEEAEPLNKRPKPPGQWCLPVR